MSAECSATNGEYISHPSHQGSGTVFDKGMTESKSQRSEGWSEAGSLDMARLLLTSAHGSCIFLHKTSTRSSHSKSSMEDECAHEVPVLAEGLLAVDDKPVLFGGVDPGR